MTAYRKELVLGVIFVIITILHVDFWWWNAREPWLFGILPFSMWWGVIVTLLTMAALKWWISWGWPAPPEEYNRDTSGVGEG